MPSAAVPAVSIRPEQRWEFRVGRRNRVSSYPRPRRGRPHAFGPFGGPSQYLGLCLADESHAFPADHYRRSTSDVIGAVIRHGGWTRRSSTAGRGGNGPQGPRKVDQTDYVVDLRRGSPRRLHLRPSRSERLRRGLASRSDSKRSTSRYAAFPVPSSCLDAACDLGFLCHTRQRIASQPRDRGHVRK